MREILYHPLTRKHTIQCHHPIRRHTIQSHRPIRKHTIQYHNPIRKVVMIIHYKYKATPSVKGMQTHTQNIRPLAVSLFYQKETDLGIGAATSEALADPSSFLFLQRSATAEECHPQSLRITIAAVLLQRRRSASNSPASQQSRSGPTTSTRSTPVPVKKSIISYPYELCQLIYKL